jgi:pimeloyl-ACP methyl ester carboxylesterase
MQVDPAVATERVELLRRDASFATAAEAVETRIADPTLYTTPRGVVEAEAAEHLYARDDGRLSWRFYPPMAIVAWSEMTTAAPPWPRCPTLLLVGARSWITPAASVPPNVSLVTVPGGHAVMWDDFDATGAAVSAFVGGPSRLSG